MNKNKVTRWIGGVAVFLMASAANAGTWHLVNPRPTVEGLTGCVAAASDHYAVGDLGTVLHSADGGATWELIDTPTTMVLYSISEGNGQLLATGRGQVLVSSDGTSWSSHDVAGDTTKIYDGLWDGSRFVIAKNTAFYSSTDGVNWTDHSSTGLSSYVRAVAYDGATYYAAGQNGMIAVSSDLASWAGQTSGTAVALYGIAESGGTYVAVGATGTILYSTDGSTWNAAVSGTSNDLNDVYHDGSQFVAVGNVGKRLTSTDGITWSSKSGFYQPSIEAVCGSGGASVGVGAGGFVITSVDGNTWTLASSNLDNLSDVVVHGGTIVAVGTNSNIRTSSDGATWQDATGVISAAYRGVIYHSGAALFVAAGSNGVILGSSDGLAWNQLGTAGDGANDLQSIASDGTTLVVTGLDGTVFRSTDDGATWFDVTPGSHSGVTFQAYYEGGNFILVSSNVAPSYLSTDSGANWTAGDTNDVGEALVWDVSRSRYSTGYFISSDGLSWTQATAQGFCGDIVIESDGSLYCIGAYGPYSSTDGDTWSSETAFSGVGLSGLAVEGDIAVTVGANGAIFFRSNLILTESGGTTDVVEGGSSDSYTLALASPPAHDVTITPSPASMLSVTPSALTFTSGNWSTPQAFTVNAVDDVIAYGTHSADITHTVTSTDAAYDGATAPTVSVNVTDNDQAGLTVTESGGSTDVSEDGSTDTVTVVLDTQPTADVTVTVSPDQEVANTPESLTFTSANWDSPQTVTIEARNDHRVEGTHNGLVSFDTGSFDAGYSGLSTTVVSAAVTDDDTAGITIDAPSVAVAEGGSHDTYTVVLTSEPAADVEVAFSGSGQVNVALPTLTFTPLNWQTPQTVTVTAVDDSDKEGSHTGSISHAVSSADADYDGMVLGDVEVSVADNDLVPGTIGLTAAEFGVAEADGSLNITVSRTGGSDGAVGIDYSVSDGTATSGSDYTSTSGTLTWTDGDSADKTITVSILEDVAVEEGETFTLNLSNATGGSTVGTAAATITITDNDTAVTNTGGQGDTDTGSSSTSDKKSGGGSTGSWMLALLGLLAMRRRQRV